MTAIKPDSDPVKSRWVARSAALARVDDARAESWRYDLAAARQIMDEDAGTIAGRSAFVSGVVRALVTAGIRQSGGHGVAALHHRAQSLAQAVQSIDRVLKDGDIGARLASEVDPRKMVPRFVEALAAISEVCEGVAADVFIVDQGKAARATLAAHGWAEVGSRTWHHAESGSDAIVESGTVEVDGYPASGAELRAFATLAEETRP